MPNYGPRTSWAIGSVPEFEPDWLFLERTLKAPITPDARSRLERVWNTYFAERTLEVNAAILSDVKKHLETLTTAAGGLADSLEGVDFENAAREDANGRFYRHLEVGAKLEIDLAECLPSEKDGSFREIEDPRVISITRRLVMDLLPHLRNAAVKAEKELLLEMSEKGGSPLFEPGAAFKRFLFETVEWANASNISSSTNNRSAETTPFSRFVHSLHASFPKDMQWKTMTAAAVHKQINLVKRRSVPRG